ncbi:MmgE/PrpD family protein [Nonomuraea sp. NPDC002799]
MTVPAALRIGRYAATAQPPPDSADAVARAVLDTVAVAVAAGRDPIVRALTTTVTPGEVSLWTGGPRTSPEQAALINGTAGHVLDYDDVTSPLRGHPSIALIPGLLALAEAEDADGAAVATAYVVGFEVMLKLAKAMAAPHYAAGWHATTTIGGIGATVAAARLLRLEAGQIADAIGLFLGQCGGTRENFGTAAKSFQVGAACANAVRAALAARAGLTAGHGALDGPAGFTHLYADGEDATRRLHGQLDDLGSRELRTSGLDVKKYPMCYAAHRALDVVLDLRTEADLNAKDVVRAEVRTSGAALTPLIHHRPETGLEAKFSMEYGLATALLGGPPRLTDFTDEAVRRPEARHLLARVHATETHTPLSPRWAEVSLHLTDGRVLRGRAETLRGSAAAPLTMEELTAKAVDCFEHGGRARRARRFAAALRGWADRPVRDVLTTIQEERP